MGTDTTTAPDAETGDLGITELVEFDPTRLDGVKSAATGIPFLLMKSVAAADVQVPDVPGVLSLAVLAKAMNGGQVDEAPDISTGRQVMTLLGQAIGSEAEELGAGHYDEVADVRMLARAADIVSCWIAREKAVQAGQDPNMACGCCEWCTGIGCGCCPGCGAGMVMCSAADEAVKAAESTASQNDLPDSAFAFIESGGKKDADGKTTPRSLRHFPVHDKAHASNALARLSSSPFGDKAKSKVHAAAKKFGIDVSDAAKGAVAEGATTVQDDQQGDDGQIAKAVADAVTKATEPLKELKTELESVLAKVKATPIPGGPVLSSAVRTIAGQTDGSDHAAKSAYYREMAETVTDRVTADGYRKLARDEADKAKAAVAS